MKQGKNAVIIGAGLGGIATAIRLAVKDFRVEVFEATEGPGGKLNIIRKDGFRYDFGPSLFTMPHFVEDLFRLAGKDPQDYFRYKTMDIACRYFWEDGTVLKAWTNKWHLAAEVREKLGVEEEVIINYINHAMRLYKKTSPVFLEKSLHEFRNYFSADLLRTGSYFPQMDIFTTMDKANKKRLKHPKLVQLFNRMATYNGSSPYQTPGIMTIISSLEHGYGVYFPEGGMYAITKSLVALAEELGVKFHYHSPVEKIMHRHQSVTGIETQDGSHYPADVVVSNMDVYHSYKKLLKDIPPPKKALSQERSSSALVFYWGINREFPELDLHNIFFSKNYPEEFNYLFKKLEMYHDPTVYVHISSKVNPEDAPPGNESWFVMVNAPHNIGQDWDQIIEETRKNVLKKLSGILRTNVGDYIVSEHLLDPPKIESLTSSYQGSLYGTSSNSKFAAFLRHPNFTSKLKGLYFAGGSVHPGGGIPLVLQSAKITAGMIGKD